jgi:hypothetical protein
MNTKAEQMMKLFSGLKRAHGAYLQKSPSIRPGEKMEGRCTTLNEPVTAQLWENHLNGIKGIGIIPINDDSTCTFGAIDIDIYSGISYSDIASKIKKYNLPLVTCKSKSSGIHCFMFVAEQVPAIQLIEKLRMLASFLGFGNSEIFPKQSVILSERGDIGQWINMPYFGNTRFAFDEKGADVPLDQFIELATKKVMNIKEFNLFNIQSVSDISDGPPCLQNLIKLGFTPGCRNDSLFNFGVYIRKKFKDGWENQLDAYNESYMSPKLSHKEVSDILKSLKKKEYFYTCEKSPFKEHCNKAQCKTREYGIGQMCGMPQLNGLTKYNSNPPIWFIDVEGFGRMELTTDELQSQVKFQRKSMETLNKMPPIIKPLDWQRIIHALLENVNVIEMPPEASSKGIFFQLVEQFCTSRMQAKTKDEIILGKPFSDDTNHLFRLIDLMNYLDRNRFYEFKINKVASLLKEIGGENHYSRVKDKGFNLWKIPLFQKNEEVKPIVIKQENVL